MNFLMAIELILGFLLVLLTVSQVLVPLWNDRPIFPILNRVSKLQKNIGEVKTEIEADHLQMEVDSLKRSRSSHNPNREQK